MIGYPLLGVLVLVGALGLPLPLEVMLAAAGALARQGHLNLGVLLVVCTLAAVCGDCLGYELGRVGVPAVVARTHGHLWARIRGWPASPRMSALVARVDGRIGMGMLVFFTRWAVTTLGPVVNVLAGWRHYRWSRFLAVDAIGEALWVALSLAPGYWLGGFKAGLTLAIVAGALLTLAAGIVVVPVSGKLRQRVSSRSGKIPALGPFQRLSETK